MSQSKRQEIQEHFAEVYIVGGYEDKHLEFSKSLSTIFNKIITRQEAKVFCHQISYYGSSQVPFGDIIKRKVFK